MLWKMMYSPCRMMIKAKNFALLVLFLLIAGILIFNTSASSDDANEAIAMMPLNDSMAVCFESYKDNRERVFAPNVNDNTVEVNPEPIIYFVTPTYPRREQIAEITRLGQTLMHIPNLHWIVADDTENCNRLLNNLLKKFGIPYTHIASPMPEFYRTKKLVPRGVANRRAALAWIRNNNKKTGVLYFGDDDNTFDLKLFSEIRTTKKVSMFPVGLIGDYAVSTPVVRNGMVEGFFDSWPAKRKWPVDMAGFAVNLEYMALSPNVTMPFRAGYEEDEFLKSLGLKMQDIEPKANNCTEILVWHTQTKNNKPPKIRISSGILENDVVNLGVLLKQLVRMGVSHISQSDGTKAQITKDGKSKSLVSWFS
ncbi:galactosylgalactosylxylosylprotein 3-beta-glucuronosyltransferase S [Toxorhynchites rutilus septentrionalis]|uniref:galactosylgalactosylxylosylprotein 3-beta-glucuronosyltransferase S n=1 Tax=Toxorhynchites rutilus septentrionalis TaxID=329112 RepID=UPI0024783643|nr:galactosylgalactosylxylosylprotein 3-beta-glucuronosyltransferase S [Toxorhynchites rutilus septentrionalis]